MGGRDIIGYGNQFIENAIPRFSVGSFAYPINPMNRLII